MSGIIHLIWYLSVIAFFPLLAYAVVKRPLWVPGLVVMSYPNVGMARVPLPLLGIVRGYHLIAIAGFILIVFILIKKRRSAQRQRLGFADQAPLFLFGLLVIAVFRMTVDYVSSGRLFYPNEITLALVSTMLPLFILIIYPPKAEVFQEFMWGVALGSLLSIFPAFMDFEVLSSLVENLASTDTLQFERLHFRDRNTTAFYAFQGAVSMLFLLHVGKHSRRFKTLLYMVSAVLIMFMLLNQSRRWFAAFLCLGFLYYFSWLRERKSFLKTPAEVVLFKLIPGVAVLLIGLFLIYGIQERFERFEINELVGELDSASFHSRADIWNKTLKNFQKYPILGSGMLVSGWEEVSYEKGSGRIISRYVGAHNLFMDILVQYGIIGGICAAVFFLSVFLSIRKWKKRGRSAQFTIKLSLIFIYWISLLVAAFTGGGSPHNMGLIALLPAVARMMIKTEQHNESMRWHRED